MVSHAKLHGPLGVGPTFDNGEDTLMPHGRGRGNIDTPIIVAYSRILNALQSHRRRYTMFLYLVYAYLPWFFVWSSRRLVCCEVVGGALRV
jgi:hypothetical protein